ACRALTAVESVCWRWCFRADGWAILPRGSVESQPCFWRIRAWCSALLHRGRARCVPPQQGSYAAAHEHRQRECQHVALHLHDISQKHSRVTISISDSLLRDLRYGADTDTSGASRPGARPSAPADAFGAWPSRRRRTVWLSAAADGVPAADVFYFDHVRREGHRLM